MNVLRGDPAAWDAAGPHAVTIGVFDGVHRGHLHVIGLVRAGAERLGIGSGLITFDRHPLTVLAPEHAPPLLTPLETRLELFEAAGLDTVGVLPFDDSVRTLSPEDFALRVIVMGFGARLVVVGEDFRFGLDRAGNVEVLARVGGEVGFDVLPVALVGDGGPLSSSRIRALVAAGEVEAAAASLGRPYELRGRVAGRPAAFEVPPGLAVPGRGAYAVVVRAPGASPVPGVAHLGGGPALAVHPLGGRAVEVGPASLEFAARLGDVPPPGDDAAAADQESAARAVLHTP